LDCKLGDDCIGGVIVKRSTIKSTLKRLGDREITLDNVFPLRRGGLLTGEQTKIVQDIVCKRDLINNPMGRKEWIWLIADLGQASSLKQAENKLGYLINWGQQADLTRGGSTILAQAAS